MKEEMMSKLPHPNDVFLGVEAFDKKPNEIAQEVAAQEWRVLQVVAHGEPEGFDLYAATLNGYCVIPLFFCSAHPSAPVVQNLLPKERIAFDFVPDGVGKSAHKDHSGDYLRLRQPADGLTSRPN